MEGVLNDISARMAMRVTLIPFTSTRGCENFVMGNLPKESLHVLRAFPSSDIIPMDPVILRPICYASVSILDKEHTPVVRDPDKSILYARG